MRQGGDLVGAYVGNWSANAVKDLFDKAWGGVGVIDEASAIDTAVEFTEQSIKAMLPRLEQKTCLIIAADYAHKMDHFLGLDAGLAGRFRRVSTKAFSPQAAFLCLTKELAAKRVDTGSLNKTRVELALEILVQLPGFANGRDIVKTMAPDIAKLHRKANRGSPGAPLSTEVILSYLEDFTQQVASRTKASLSPQRGDLSFARQRKVAVPPPPEQVKTAPTRERIQQAIQKVDASFADLANSDPARFKQLLSDPSSEYYQELGKELGTSSTEAHASMQKEIAQRTVELESAKKTLSPSKKLIFDYHCPYCGGTNSPDCFYFSNSETVKPSSFAFSKEWLLAHSLKEPYEVDA
jgi:hypothetical protein